jgi:CDP-glucose 4,6-dehydratase
MGTINLLEVLKKLDSVKSIVIVTTDKVYKNTENDLCYSENDSLGGHDPYSSSKAAVELAVESWRNSFFANNEPQVGIATARAGNVIGGGDWGENRLIPDYFRAHLNGEMFQMRNPNSIRPWQHILDVACGYLILGMKTSQFPFEFSESYNFGPINGKYSTRDIINFLSNESSIYDGKEQSKSQYKETNKLYLNSEKARKKLLWKNFLTTERAIKLTSEYYLNFQKGNAREIIMSQIISYMGFFDEHIDEA